jgi:hypothetical protein
MKSTSRKRLSPSTTRGVSRPQDPDERQARRAADVVAAGGSVAGWSFSAVPASAPERVQREETGKPKSDDDKKKEAASKAAEAALETPPGKALKEKVLADPLVKTVKDAVSTPGGLAVAGTALAGGVVALGAAKKELPFQPPAIPLDRITPGLSAQVKVEGPVNSPTFVGLTLTYKEQGPKAKKAAGNAIADEKARLLAQQEMLKPTDQKAAEKRDADEFVQAWVTRQKFTLPLTPGALPRVEDAKPDEPKKNDEQTPVQRSPATATAQETPASAHVDDALSAPGRPLDASLRRSMEARFGYDFSSVRVHDDARSAATAASIDAAAFTVGEDVVFASGRYDPSSPDGRRLLAHELAHVVQQRLDGAAQHGPVQRVGVGEFLSRLFGEGTFTDEELEAYLLARDGGAIEDNYDSDNKARAIVRAWRTGGSKWVLTAKRKAVLIREMLSGATYDDDEQMILELLVRSFNAELQYIFTVGNVKPKDVDSALDGLEHRRLEAFFERRFQGGKDAVLKGDVRPQGDAAPLGDDIESQDDLVSPDLPGAVHEWSVPCLLGIFCTLAPDVITSIRSIKVKRFTQMDVDRWSYDGKAWTKEVAHPDGFEYSEGSDVTVGLQRRRDCGDVAATLKHEAVHAGQKSGTRYERELEAYTEGERFAISYGLRGKPGLRTTAEPGAQEPDKAKVEKYVRTRYGGPEAGKPEDVLVDHKSDGKAVIKRADDTTYEREPKEGDVYLDEEPKLIGDEDIPPDSWKCPGGKS